MDTYLFIWNPTKYEKLYDDQEKWVRGRLPKDSWSSGNSKSIRKGSRAFLIRSSVEPKGVIASGTVISDWYTRPHYLEPSRTENVNDIAWDAFADPSHPPVLLNELLKLKNQTQGLWLSAANGVKIPNDVAETLEIIWAAAIKRDRIVQRVPFLDPNEVTTKVYPEGAVIRIPVNAYERNEEARRACLVHYGATCSACGFDFDNTYGRIGRGFIHVHHLKLLSEIGEEYEVDPIEDLRPVCPNCHAMLHKETPPLTIERLKSMIRG